MADTTIKKVEAGSSPLGEMGQKYLVAGKRVSMRLWTDEPGGKLKGPFRTAQMHSAQVPKSFQANELHTRWS
jgi:hypothetical protein